MMSARTMSRRAAAMTVTALLVSCSQGGPPISTPPSPPVASGIVVVSVEDAASPVIGFIDPSSGNYTQGPTLNVSPQSFGVSDGGDIRLAPDWSRYAVTRQVGDVGHAGWVDRHGKFTDVNVASDAIGFDGLGNFFYRVEENDQSSIYVLPNGQTSGGEPAPYLPSGDGIVFKRDGTGRLFDLSSCPTFAAHWLTPTEYLHVSTDGMQIFRTNVAETPGLRDCDSPLGTALLRADNTSPVSSPVASPDGTRVAYLRDGGELWIVDGKDGGNPTRVNVTGIDLGPTGKSVLEGWTSPATGFNRPQDFSHRPDMAGTWTGNYFSPRLDGAGSVALHVDRSDPLAGSIVTKAPDLVCNSSALETKRTAQSLSVEVKLKAGADPRCRGTSTVELSWMGERLSGVLTESTEADFVGGTLIVARR